MEPEGLFPCSQEAVTVPCSEPAESVAHSSVAYVRKVHFNIVSTSVPKSSKWPLLLEICDFRFVRVSHVPHAGPEIVRTTVYSLLSRLMEAKGMHGWLRKTENPNFIFYTPTAPLARRRLWNALFSHISYFTGRLIVGFCFFKKFRSLVFYFVVHFPIFFISLFVFFLPFISS
jgi:hypothetical protein